jgi:hypothetical protein
VPVTHVNPEVQQLKLKVKAYATFGAVLGLGLGIGIGTGIGGAHWGNQNQGAYVSALFSPPDI